MKHFVFCIKISLIILVILFTASILNTRYQILDTANAAGVSLGIFPPVIQIEATAPSDVKTKLQIQNLDTEPVTLSIGTKPFEAAPSQNGEVYYPQDYSPLLADPFIFDKMQILDADTPIDSITLAPQQKKELTLEISLPNGEPSGDYYFSVVFISDNNSLTNSTNTVTAGGIATNVLLSVGPKGPTQGNIQEFSAPSFVTNGPVPFTVKIDNTSTHFITTDGSIEIKNMFGQTVGKVDLLPVNILANSARYIPDSLQGPQAEASPTLKSYFSGLKSPAAVWPETFLLGPYTATLTVALSSQGPLFRRTISFFAFPVYPAMAILIIAVILVIIITRVRRIQNNV